MKKLLLPYALLVITFLLVTKGTIDYENQIESYKEEINDKSSEINGLITEVDSLIKELQLRRKHNMHSKDYKFVLFINLVKVSKLVKSSKSIFFRKKHQTPEKK